MLHVTRCSSGSKGGHLVRDRNVHTAVVISLGRSVADSDPGSGTFLTPRSGIRDPE